MCFVYKAQSKQKASKQVIIGKKKCSLTIQVLSLFLKNLAKSNTFIPILCRSILWNGEQNQDVRTKKHGNRPKTAAMLNELLMRCLANFLQALHHDEHEDGGEDAETCEDTPKGS